MSLPRLFVLTPGDLDPRGAAGLRARLEGTDRAGVALLLREPGLSDGPYLSLARELRAAFARTELWLHDRPHLVVAAGASGVHVGFRSLAPEDARRVGTFPVGLSTHAGDDPASWATADHLFHGPLRATPSKAGLLEPVGFEGLRTACARTERPVFALGGVCPEDVAPCLGAGAAGVAVLGGVFRADTTPARAVARYLDALAEAAA